MRPSSRLVALLVVVLLDSWYRKPCGSRLVLTTTRIAVPTGLQRSGFLSGRPLIDRALGRKLARRASSDDSGDIEANETNAEEDPGANFTLEKTKVGGSVDAFLSSTWQGPGSKAWEEAVAAWLHETLRTTVGKSIGQQLFLCNASERKRASKEAVNRIKGELLWEDYLNGDNLEEEVAFDSIFLGMHACAAEADGWLGVDSWANAIITQAALPGLGVKETERIVLRGVEAVKAEEVRVVISSFNDAMWMDTSYLTGQLEEGSASVMISAPPPFAAIQYTIGILWGYALRGLVLRLALDRTLGTLPEAPARMRRRGEGEMASNATGPGTSQESTEAAERKGDLTLLQYATEFFGHSDWMALSDPSDAALVFLEGEIEEAKSSIAMLAGAEDDDDTSILNAAILGLENEQDAERYKEDMVTLPHDWWQGFQRRAVAVGSLLADSEALTESHTGRLPRGAGYSQEWITQLKKCGMLSEVSREQWGMTASRLLSPVQRLTQALRKHLIGSKLRAAREGLESLFKTPPAQTQEG